MSNDNFPQTIEDGLPDAHGDWQQIDAELLQREPEYGWMRTLVFFSLGAAFAWATDLSSIVKSFAG